MTAPIQEPSTDRALQGFAYARDQIFRRPQASNCCDYPYVFRKMDSGQTIGPGNIEVIVFDDDDFSQAAGFFTPGDTQSFDIEGPGVFDFLGAGFWDAPFNSKTMFQVQCNAFGNFPSQLGWGGFYSDAGVNLDQGQAFFIHFQARVDSGTSATSLAISQANAAGQLLVQAFFRVAYIAEWTPGTGVGSEADFVFL